MRALLVFLAVASLLVACNNCKPGTQRCNASVVEFCRPDKQWSQVQDCSKTLRTDKEWTCACGEADEAGKSKCTCIPQE